MKTYKYSTKERANRVSKTLGCLGFHSHGNGDEKIYMPCKTHEIFLKTIKKEKKGEETEMTELVDTDGTWLTSKIPILNPASTGVGTKTTDQIVQAARSPSDPLLRGWHGFYRESKLEEENMEDAFGFEDTMFMDYNKTVNHYQKELGLDKDSAIDRAVQQGKKPNLVKRAPKKIKNKKNFIDRLILKEKGLDENNDIIEDVLLDKETDNLEIKNNVNIGEIHPLLLRNVKSLRKFAKENNVSIKDLIKLIKDEQ